MKPDSIEAAFARFCERCDPAAMAEVFDRTADELRPLARRLTRGRVEADDLIQETFLAAIENRTSFDPARPLMPWLVGILVRQASAARRRARREVDPTRIETRTVAAPDEDVEGKELQAVVMEALSRLSRHDRDVLMPLLFDGKRAVQIARELGSRPDTIRMRIHRGLDRLRRLLPVGVMMPGFLRMDRSWNEVRATVLGRAARLSGLPAPAAAGAGGAAVGAWVAFALLLSLAGLWAIAHFGSRNAADDGGTSAALEAAAEPPAIPAVKDVAADTGRASVARAEPAAPEPSVEPDRVRISGHVRGLAASEIAAARIEIAGLGPEPIALREQASLAPDASFEVDVTRLARLGARRLLVRADHPERSPAEARIELGSERELEAGTLTLPDARTVDGRVLAHDGRALAGATVGLFSLQRGAQDVLPVDVAVADASGSFHLRSPARGQHVLIAFREKLRPASRLVDLSAGALDAGELRLEPGLSISGAVVGAGDGERLGVRVRCEAAGAPGERKLRLADRRFLRVGESWEYATILADCDAAGRFAFDGLGTQPCHLSVQELGAPDGFAPDAVQAPIAASDVRAPRFDLKLASPWSVIELSCAADAAGERPRAEDELAVDVATLPDPQRAAPPPGSVRLRPRLAAPVRLQVRPGTRYRFTLQGCTAGGAGSFTAEAPASGRVSRFALDLPPAEARATLVLHFRGAELARGELVGVGFFPAEAAAAPLLFERTAALDAGRSVTLDQLPPGRWRARVRTGGTYSRSFGFALAGEVEVELAAGSSVEREVRAERGGRARLVVRSSTGAPLTTEARLFDAAGSEFPLDCVSVDPETSQEMTGRIVVDRPNELGPLAAGNWRLELSALWHEPLSVPLRIETDRVTELDVRLQAR